jgi:hypothetical protein
VLFFFLVKMFFLLKKNYSFWGGFLNHGNFNFDYFNYQSEYKLGFLFFFFYKPQTNTLFSIKKKNKAKFQKKTKRDLRLTGLT